MPAHSSVFPWPSYYGHFKFFEKMMRTHSDIRDVTALGDGVFELSRISGQILRVFVCECYSFGAAEYIETTENLNNLDAVIISSNWCGYTFDAKALGRAEKVGLFNIRGLMVALNKTEVWAYLDKFELEYFKKEGLL